MLPCACHLYSLVRRMDGWMFSRWISTPAHGPQDGPYVHHGLYLMSLIFVFVLGSQTKQFMCCMYLVKIVWSYQHYSYSCFLSINWLLASVTPTITVTPDLFWIHLSLQWLMSVKLNRPPKPEESQKNSNFNGKTIPYLGFEPGTSGLAV
jgi:hypothetical protein